MNTESNDIEEVYIGYLRNVLTAIEQNDLDHALCQCSLAWWAKNSKTIEDLDDIELKYCGKLEYKQEAKTLCDVLLDMQKDEEKATVDYQAFANKAHSEHDNVTADVFTDIRKDEVKHNAMLTERIERLGC